MKALLDQLRGSQAWKEVAAPPAEIGQASDDQVTAAGPSTSVASLLSQLQSAPSWGAAGPASTDVSRPPPRALVTSRPFPEPLTPLSPEPAPAVALAARPEDLRSCTFQQALPHIAQLANDPGFVAAIKQVLFSHGLYEM